MREKMRYSVAILLVVSALLLGVLVPGGPIETRDFSQISPLVLGAFNTFLTILGLGSFAFSYFVLKGRRWAFIASSISAISYFLVYILDLGKVFPISPDEMPRVLFVIEVLGALVSLPLAYLSLKSSLVGVDNSEGVTASKSGYNILLFGLIVLVGIGIIIFATVSAMGM